jgi:hypothetical protein
MDRKRLKKRRDAKNPQHIEYVASQYISDGYIGVLPDGSDDRYREFGK